MENILHVVLKLNDYVWHAVEKRLGSQVAWEEDIERDRFRSFCPECGSEVTSMSELLLLFNEERYSCMRRLGLINT